jgi:neuroblastoma-amplified sequence
LRIVREKDFIEATSRLSSFNITSRPGIPISPIEIRLTKDRLSLVSRVLSCNAEAYKHTQVILDLVHKLGLDDVVAEVKTLAMLADTALQAEDFARAYESSERMVASVLELRTVATSAGDSKVLEASEVCWVACFQLGRQAEFDDVPKKMLLLARALELCPPNQLHDVLAAWRKLAREDNEERRESLANRQSGAPSKKSNSNNPAPSLASRLQNMHISASPLAHTPELASRAFSRVAAHLPFSVRPRSRERQSSEDARSGMSPRLDGDVATRVFQKGIGWLIGADDDT